MKKIIIFAIIASFLLAFPIYFSCRGKNTSEAFVSSVVIDEDGKIKLVYSDNKKNEIGSIAVNNGDKYVVNARLNEQGGLVLVFNDKSEVAVGNVVSTNAIMVTNVSIDKNGELLVTFSNGQVTNLGNVTANQGLSIKNIELNDKNQLIITYTNGFQTNLGTITCEDVVSITKVFVNLDGHLIIITSDGKETDAGCVVGEKGDPGQDGRGIETVYINDKGELIVVLTDKSEINLGVIIPGQANEKPLTEEERFANVKNALMNSKPTKVATNINYYRPDIDLSLNSTSTLVIQYSQIIKSIYTYSHQKLNRIEDAANGMISTTSGTIYSEGSSLGTLDNGTIKWYDSIEGNISLFNITFAKEYFNENFQITNTSFIGDLKPEMQEKFFGQNYNLRNVKLTIVLTDDYQSIKRISLSYVNGLDAVININCMYTYEVEKVDVIK